MAAELVPGVLLANRKISARQPSLVDLAPTVLSELAGPTAVAMEGRSIF
jgi:hypothetical protein